MFIQFQKYISISLTFSSSNKFLIENCCSPNRQKSESELYRNTFDRTWINEYIFQHIHSMVILDWHGERSLCSHVSYFFNQFLSYVKSEPADVSGIEAAWCMIFVNSKSAHIPKADAEPCTWLWEVAIFFPHAASKNHHVHSNGNRYASHIWYSFLWLLYAAQWMIMMDG